jgi:hypothetical protein
MTNVAPKATREERLRLDAEQRAWELWRALDQIEKSLCSVQQLVENHDPLHGDNAVRRDCARFQSRLHELGLTGTTVRFLQAHKRPVPTYLDPEA